MALPLASTVFVGVHQTLPDEDVEAVGKIVAEEAASQRAYEHDRERIDSAKGHPVRTMSGLLLLVGG